MSTEPNPNSGEEQDPHNEPQRSDTFDDGRNIDLTIGSLEGEAASQATLSTKHDAALHRKAFAEVPGRHFEQPSPTYYDYPVLKTPVWIWSIPAYFYVGGLCGVSATLGAAAQVLAPRRMETLIVRTRWIATAGGAVSAALLIHDLGRPERFLNMLRVFRLRSPMSMGSWILSVFSGAAGAAAVLPFGPKLFRPLAGVSGVLAGIFGLGLAGYTGVLLSQTAVPVWHRAYRVTPVLFLASGAAASASFLDFFSWNESELAAIEWFGRFGKALELAAALRLEREVSHNGDDANRALQRVGRPLHEGFSGFLWQTSKVLTVASAVISIIPGKGRKKRILAGILGSAASACLRFGVFYAGKNSAADPRATFESQRAVPAEAADA